MEGGCFLMDIPEYHYVKLLEYDDKSILFFDLLTKKEYLIESDDIYTDIECWCRDNNISKIEVEEIIGVRNFDKAPITQVDTIYMNRYTLNEYHNEDFVINTVEDYISGNFDKWVLNDE